MSEILYWGFWFCVVALLAGMFIRMAEEAPVIGFFGFLVSLGIVAVIAMGIYDMATSENYTIPKNNWECTSWVGHQTAPTYIKQGNMLVPVGGGETKECVQYNKVR